MLGTMFFFSVAYAVRYSPTYAKIANFRPVQWLENRPSRTKFSIVSRIWNNQPGSRGHGSPWQTCNHQQQVRPYSTVINLAVRSFSFHPSQPALNRYFTNSCRVYKIHLGRTPAHRSLTRRRDLNYTARSTRVICVLHPRQTEESLSARLDRHGKLISGSIG